MNNSSCVIIPARYESSRFPGKPLKKILGKEMILWVSESCSKAVGKKNVYVATNHFEINNLLIKNGFNTIMTSNKAETGTDRIAECVENLNYEIIINVQGDEPLVDPEDIKKCIKYKKQFPEKIINGYTFLNKKEDPNNVNIPKLVTNDKNELIYMSRKAIPGYKNDKNKPILYKKQVCIYGFHKKELVSFKAHGKSKIENFEDIEILRFFELNKTILMFECISPTIAVDVPEDIEIVENFLKK